MRARRLVVLGATAGVARAAHSLGCHTVFVQQPRSPVEALVHDDSHLYSVDYTAATFAEFVDRVLRSLAPDAVVSVAASGLLPAAVANSVLGLSGTGIETVRRLREGRGAVSAEGRELDVVTFVTGGSHQLLAVVERHPVTARMAPAGLPPAVAADVEEAVNGHLDEAGLRDGPARTTVTVADGEVRVHGTLTHLGDGDQPELVRRISGIDVQRWSLGWPLGVRGTDCLETGTVSGTPHEGIAR